MSVDIKTWPVDAVDILHQVSRQIRRDSVLPARTISAVRFHFGPVQSWRGGVVEGRAPEPLDDFEEAAHRLQVLYKSLDTSFATGVAQIGAMPPTVATWRGFLGRAVIRMLQRLLWWYTRSVQGYAESMGSHFHKTAEVLESLAYMQEVNRMEIVALRDEVRRLQSQLPAEAGDD